MATRNTIFSDENSCPLCKIAEGKLPAAIITEDKDVLAIMDLYPATAGHILVLPRKHIPNIYLMPDDVGTHIMTMAITVARAIIKQLQPAGLNLIQANGAAAGQTINHFHLHLVPRYEDDGVILKFGHGSVQGNTAELEQIASKIRNVLA